MHKKSFTFIAIIFVSIIFTFSGLMSADRVTLKPKFKPAGVKLKVSGYVQLINSNSVGVRIKGLIKLSHNGKPFQNAQVKLGKLTFSKYAPGDYVLSNQLFNQSTTDISMLYISYKSVYPQSSQSIKIPIKNTILLKILNPSGSTLSPTLSKMVTLSWSEILPFTYIHILDMTSGLTYSNNSVNGKTHKVTSSFFKIGNQYDMSVSGEMGLKILGIVERGSHVVLRKSASKRFKYSKLVLKSVRKK